MAFFLITMFCVLMLSTYLLLTMAVFLITMFCSLMPLYASVAYYSRFPNYYVLCSDGGCSGSMIELGKLPVPGHPTNLD